MDLDTMTIDTTLFDGFTGTFLITDTSGKVLYANKSIEDRTGYSAAEVIGKRPGGLWGGNMCRHFYNDLWGTISEKKLPFVGVVNNRSKGGREYSEMLHISPIMKDDGDIKYYIELHPGKNKSWKNREKQFSNDFISAFSSQDKYERQLLSWVYESLSRGEGNNKIKEKIDELSKVDDSFSSQLFTLCISPIRDKYKQRLEDSELILAAQKDPQEFWILYKKYTDDVLHYFLRRLAGKSSVAYELMQETFLRAFRYLPKFVVSNASYRTYLLRIAHNLLVNYHRKVKTVSIDNLPESYFVSRDVYSDIWRRDDIDRAMKVLSEVEVGIVRMKYFEGLSVREIAGIVQKTENAVKLHLSRARKKMRKKLDM